MPFQPAAEPRRVTPAGWIGGVRWHEADFGVRLARRQAHHSGDPWFPNGVCKLIGGVFGSTNVRPASKRRSSRHVGAGAHGVATLRAIAVQRCRL